MYDTYSIRPTREDLKTAQQKAVRRLEARLSREQIADILGYPTRDMIDQVMSDASTAVFPAPSHVALAIMDDELALYGRPAGTTVEPPPSDLDGSTLDEEREIMQQLGPASLAAGAGRRGEALDRFRRCWVASRRAIAELLATPEADRPSAGRAAHPMPQLGGRAARAEVRR